MDHIGSQRLAPRAHPSHTPRKTLFSVEHVGWFATGLAGGRPIAESVVNIYLTGHLLPCPLQNSPQKMWISSQDKDINPCPASCNPTCLKIKLQPQADLHHVGSF